MGAAATVSREWLEENARRDERAGWVDGPVWRSPGFVRRELEAAAKAAK